MSGIYNVNIHENLLHRNLRTDNKNFTRYLLERVTLEVNTSTGNCINMLN